MRASSYKKYRLFPRYYPRNKRLLFINEIPEATVKNFSLGGILISLPLDYVFPKEEFFQVRFGSKRINLKAYEAWTENDKSEKLVGLRFYFDDYENFRLWLLFVNAYHNKFYESVV